MLRYILKRLGFALITLVIIILVVYLLVAQFTENPFLKAALSKGLNSGDSSEASQKLFKEAFEQSVKFHLVPSDLNLSDYPNGTWANIKVSPIVRFGYWVQNLFTNKQNPFGVPYNEGILTTAGATTISGFFFKFLKYSIIITLPAFVISAIIGIALGIVAGYKRGSASDAGINLFALIFVALPSFVIAPILISILFSINVPPVFLNFNDEAVVKTQGWGKIILSWIPPISIIVLGSLSGYITYTRNQVISVLTSNYILIAKSKGLSRKQIFFKYVLRNISIPLAAMLIPSYIGLLSGGIVIETYWKVPGTSQVIAQAFPNGEINIIMFSTSFFTLLSLVTTIIVDISFALLDPRIKYSSSSQYSYSRFFKAYLARERQFNELTKEETTIQVAEGE
ncbi:ABC transporter permease [Mycoplasma sp. Pen4]|uniref:ABC transporter permease n=1 Tax=Mycoplasma sp. Pen4 TaxID=640330 RepID=UPI0016548B21|nr:ABC transporter permease [Mycoplasma sp. Pen4]QNM93449.1 ABC transporter permease [Mycoplasma sp. Pen4]